MAPKKQKTSHAQSSQAFDRHRFLSYKTQEKYTNTVVQKKILAERGIDFEYTHRGPMVQTIQNWHWEQFTKQPEAAVVPVVREYYANAIESEDFKVFIRGRKVSFDRHMINQFYKVNDIENDEYTQYLTEHLNYEDVIQNIYRPGYQWKKNGEEFINFKSKYLDLYAKAWHSFICAKLMPISHVSDIIRDRTVLLFAIYIEKTVDIGKVIQNSISQSIKSSTTGGLDHPSLITALCKNAGVTWKKDEELLFPKYVINNNIIKNLKTHSDDELVAPTQSRASSSWAPVSTKDRLAKLEQDMAHLQHANTRLDQFMDYQMSFNTALVQQFSQFSLHMGQPTVQFPSAPELHPYPTPDANADDDES